MHERGWKKGLGALAAAFALSAHAQAGTAPPRTAQPAPPPAAPAAGSAATQATPESKAALESVHDWSVRLGECAKVAAAKATSPKLKQLGTQMAQENGKIDQEAQQIAQERGVQLTPAAQILAVPGHQEWTRQANTLTGAELDRFLAATLTDDRAKVVAQLKQQRDGTPGSDARLKKWLDDVENTVEGQSSLAFAARSEVNQAAQRQGRTPPPAK